MSETVSRVLIDSSAWLDYFLIGNSRIREYLDSEKFLRFSSAISIHEVKKKLLREKKSDGQVSKALDFMKNNSNVIDVTEEICEKSAADALQEKLHTTDSIIYRTAVENNAAIITLDSHFKNIKQAALL